MMLKRSVVVIDNGSFRCKAGFSREFEPRLEVDAIVGRPRDKGTYQNRYYVGMEARCNELLDDLELSYPVHRGVVRDWDGLEKLWRHLYRRELAVEPEDRPVLLTEGPLAGEQAGETMAQIMFESFHVPAVLVATSAELALYCAGRSVGLVVDVGDGVAHVVPVRRGRAQRHAVQRLELAGADLTDHLAGMLGRRGAFVVKDGRFVTHFERECVRAAKEKLCYVAMDFDREVAEAEGDPDAFEMTHELPGDGPCVTLTSERFRCPEAMFQPRLVGLECDGLHVAAHKAISMCEEDVRKLLYGNVLLTGGSTMFPGIASRMEQELRALAPVGTKIEIYTPKRRSFGAWLGGAIMGTQLYWKKCITKESYEERGFGFDETDEEENTV